MSKLSLSVLCATTVLAIATSANARGTYHHPEPYVEHSDKHKLAARHRVLSRARALPQDLSSGRLGRLS